MNEPWHVQCHSGPAPTEDLDLQRLLQCPAEPIDLPGMPMPSGNGRISQVSDGSSGNHRVPPFFHAALAASGAAARPPATSSAESLESPVARRCCTRCCSLLRRDTKKAFFRGKVTFRRLVALRQLPHSLLLPGTSQSTRRGARRTAVRAWCVIGDRPRRPEPPGWFTLWLLLFPLAHKPGSGYFCPNSRYRSVMIGRSSPRIFRLRLSVRATLRAAPVIVSTVDLLHK